MDRDLDGYYFRIKRNDKWEAVCFSDMTLEEMEEVLEGKDTVFLKRLCIGLGKRIRKIGDELNLVTEY